MAKKAITEVEVDDAELTPEEVQLTDESEETQKEYAEIAAAFSEAYLKMAELGYRPIYNDWADKPVTALEFRRYGIYRALEDYRSGGLSTHCPVSLETAQETIMLMEAASLLCANRPEKTPYAVKLVEAVVRSLKTRAREARDQQNEKRDRNSQK